MKTVLVAIGGNSLIEDEKHKSVTDQYKAMCNTASHLASIVKKGYRLLITHGNGPQVGFIMRRSEVANKSEGLHIVPLSSCVADTQGAIGFQLQTALENEFKNQGINIKTVTVVSRTVVSEDDPGFANPTKPIGSFYTEEEANKFKKEYPDWRFVEDAGRGYRRVVPSPVPKKVIETEEIAELLDRGNLVIAGGGGGIPMIEKDEKLSAVDAVIDKDLASAVLAADLNVEQLVISTGVDHAAINFGKPDQKDLKQVTVDELKKYKEEGHFAAGSMLPKVEAAIAFIERGGKEVSITSPANIFRAVTEGYGTTIKANS